MNKIKTFNHVKKIVRNYGIDFNEKTPEDLAVKLQKHGVPVEVILNFEARRLSEKQEFTSVHEPNIITAMATIQAVHNVKNWLNV